MGSVLYLSIYSNAHAQCSRQCFEKMTKFQDMFWKYCQCLHLGIFFIRVNFQHNTDVRGTSGLSVLVSTLVLPFAVFFFLIKNVAWSILPTTKCLLVWWTSQVWRRCIASWVCQRSRHRSSSGSCLSGPWPPSPLTSPPSWIFTGGYVSCSVMVFLFSVDAVNDVLRVLSSKIAKLLYSNFQF